MLPITHVGIVGGSLEGGVTRLLVNVERSQSVSLSAVLDCVLKQCTTLVAQDGSSRTRHSLYSQTLAYQSPASRLYYPFTCTKPVILSNQPLPALSMDLRPCWGCLEAQV